MSDPYKQMLAPFSEAKKQLSELNRGKSRQDKLLNALACSQRLMDDWDDNLGEYEDAAAVLARRQGFDFRHKIEHKAKLSAAQHAATRVLLRYLTGCDAKQASALVTVLHKARGRPAASIAEDIRAAGGIDKVSRMGRYKRIPQVQVPVREPPPTKPKTIKKVTRPGS